MKTTTAKTAKNSTATAKTTAKPVTTASKAISKSAAKPAAKSSPNTSLPKTSVVTAAKKIVTKKTTTKKSTATTAKPKVSTKKSSTTANKSGQPELNVSAGPSGASAEVENIVQPAATADVYQSGNADIISDPSNNSDGSFVTKLISEDNPSNLADQNKISAAVKTFIESMESAIKQLL